MTRYPSDRDDYRPPVAPPGAPYPNGCAEALLGAVQRRVSDGRTLCDDGDRVAEARRLLWRDGAAPAWHRYADAVAALLGMAPTMLWYRIDHADPRAVAMADRHYSRQTPGSPEFTRPGNKIVLMHYAEDGTPAALWASQRPDPSSGIPRADGLEAWDCSIFRIEQRTRPASELIRAAVGITASIWGAVPRDGFVTTVDPRHVAPTIRRGKPVYGYSYLKAGWRFFRITSERKLHMLQLPAADIAPLPWLWDRPVFGNVRRRWNRPVDPDQLNLFQEAA